MSGADWMLLARSSRSRDMRLILPSPPPSIGTRGVDNSAPRSRGDERDTGRAMPTLEAIACTHGISG